MTSSDATPRFQGALDRARSDWAAADAASRAAHAGCHLTPAGVLVPFFGRPHLVTHPEGAVAVLPDAPREAVPPTPPRRADAEHVHAATVIALLHYLLTADGTPPAGNWLTFRELPDGLFYAQAFAGRAEQVLVRAFGAAFAPDTGKGVADFSRAAEALGGERLDLADAGFRFTAFPRVAVAVLLWAGDEEQPGQASILFDAHAAHYVPTEDAAGLGEWLAHRVVRSRRD